MNENQKLLTDYCSFCYTGDEGIVQILLDAGADTTARMGVPANVTPIQLADDLGMQNIVQLFKQSPSKLDG